MSSSQDSLQLDASRLEKCRVVDLPKIEDARGNLTFVEGERHVPFAIKRMYYLYDVPAGAERGGHAHRRLQQFVIAISGSFAIELSDGKRSKLLHMTQSHQGLIIVPYIWRAIHSFSSGAVCAVLASEYYDEAEYIRDHREFLSITTGVDE